MNERPSLHSAHRFLLGEGRDRDAAIRAVARLENLAHQVGITFGASHAFHEIVPVPLAPLNPRYDFKRTTHLGPRNAFWVGGWAAGEVFSGVATRSAARLYNWYDGANLASESRALRVYYDHPEDAKHDEHAIISAPIADRIHGRVCFNGAVWVSPDLRGPRPELGGVFVSQIVSALSRMFALYLFDPDWCIATTPTAHFLKGTSERYGWAGIAHPAHTECVAGNHADVHLMWSRRDDMLAEAERICAEGLKVAA